MEAMVLSNAMHRVSRHSTIDIKITLENLRFLFIPSVSGDSSCTTVDGLVSVTVTSISGEKFGDILVGKLPYT